MSPDDLRALLARLGLSQVAGASFVGVEPRTMRRWCAGDQPIGTTASRLLTVADRVPAARVVIDELADPPSPSLEDDGPFEAGEDQMNVGADGQWR